jgi:hypothetical protein
VLALKEPRSFLELPAGILDDVAEGTIEAWVKWNEFNKGHQRIFSYGLTGRGGRDFALTTAPGGGNELLALMVDPAEGYKIARAKDVLKAGEWMHIAASAGSGGIRLYVGGKEGRSECIPGRTQIPRQRDARTAGISRSRGRGDDALRWRTGGGARVEVGPHAGTDPREPDQTVDRQ